jgi:hypothetical protein
VNKAKNPIVNNKGVVNLKLPPYKVAIQENILIPVGEISSCQKAFWTISSSNFIEIRVINFLLK